MTDNRVPSFCGVGSAVVGSWHGQGGNGSACISPKAGCIGKVLPLVRQQIPYRGSCLKSIGCGHVCLSCLLKLQGVASSIDPRSVDLSNPFLFFFPLSLLPPSCKKSCFSSMSMKSLWMRLGHLSSSSIVLWWSFIDIPEMSERAYGC